ncbi:hypothetical protein LJF33_13390 [Emcibacteraceae bacterium Y4]|nr:DUF6702 family protein [Pseudemcibacter aquimaris]MCC3862196.1 hypothetical protein [Pseudemcibacter aquimaris]WDU58949.1 hypothetical protein KW060_01500 [Pseudemcibacter aquimaris]
MQSEKGTIEITHRLFTHDIEDLLMRYNGGPVELTDDIIESFLQEYIIQSFALYGTDGDQIPLNWIGVEVTFSDIYVYQEAPLSDGQDTLILTNRILMDLFEEQSNTVNVKLDGKVKSHTFQYDSKLYQISFSGQTGDYPFDPS